MGCLACGRGFHFECDTGCEDCHLAESRRVAELVGSKVENLHTGLEGQPVKAPENIKDRASTGRKRAAMLYPIRENQPCEWRGKKNCGGGIPIVGCIEGIQKDCHHGPIKDTLENTPGNVHRICKHCHNRWHTVNDGLYVEAEWAKTKHEPELATEEELVLNEEFWKVKPRDRELL
jgi:hypothetical protein